ncbi:MAG: hypothetical protein HY860_04355 [Chlamydiales bacterium]|nr:hypothetical protein [Chlamydiales bacterium]
MVDSDSDPVEDDSASARVVLSSDAPKGNIDPVEMETVEDDELKKRGGGYSALDFVRYS